MYGWLSALSAKELASALTKARTAYASLMTGEQVTVAVDMNGDRAEFTRVSQQALLAYINALQAETDRRVTGASGVTRPLRFVF